MKENKAKKEKLLIARYQKVMNRGTAELTAALDKHVRMIPPDKVTEVITVTHDPLQFTLKEGGHAYHDVVSVVYRKHGEPFLRYRFRLRGSLFDFVIEEVDGTEKAPESSGLVGVDGKPL